jgi:hypothetical protein
MVKAHLKFFWIIILLHISVHGLFSQEIPVKDLILSSYIQIGSREGELGSEPSNSVSSSLPDRPLLGSGLSDGFIIYDGVNDRILLTNNKLTFQHSIATSINILLWPTIANDEQTIILQSRSQGIILFTQAREIRLSVYQFPEFRNYRSFAYYDDILFVHDAELNLWSIPDPVIDQAENRARLLNERQTREYVNERFGASGEVQVDGEGRLFIDGQLVTRDFPTWLGERGITTALSRGTLVQTVPVRRIGHSTALFISMKPVQSAPRLNTIFRYDASLVSGYPAVEYQTGDIYFLGHPVENNTSIPLYRIPNDWSPIDAGR